jgi:hypothetical protein
MTIKLAKASCTSMMLRIGTWAIDLNQRNRSKEERNDADGRIMTLRLQEGAKVISFAFFWEGLI